MNKKVFFTICCLLSVSVTLSAGDLLSKILAGDFQAKTLSWEEQDSILNGASPFRYGLEVEDQQTLYRHSFLAHYQIVDTLRKHVRKPLCDTLCRDALMSANGKYVAYARPIKGSQGANIYLHKLDFGTEVAVTTDEDAEIFNGVSDWLYEEEFGITTMMAFSPDSKQLAYVRLDETEVPSFTWQEYLTETSYPQEKSLRYPKAGCANAKVSVLVYDISTKAIKEMQIGDVEDCYIPRIGYTPDGQLYVLKMNRDQNRMDVLYCNTKSAISQLFYQEKSDQYYIDYALFDEWCWLSDGRVVIMSEKSGWRQAYLYSASGVELRQLTSDGHDVMAVYGVDEKTQTLYYLQADEPETRTAYAVSIKKAAAALAITTEVGMHSLRFADDYSQMIDCYESITQPNRYTLYAVKGTKVTKKKVLLDNEDVLSEWLDHCVSEKQFFTFVTERGDTLHGWVLVALHDGLASATGQSPVVITQYSGPDSQRVLNRWRRTWDYYLAENGYTVVCVDGRGTGARGRAWRNASYLSLGEKEAEDQLSLARHLSTWSTVDASRIAMVGWSYGGFQVLTTMSHSDNAGLPTADGQQQPLIKAGIAIAPVTDWLLYDNAYTERYMRRPKVNDGGYRKSGLIERAAELKGELLIVHGLADDNVHAQHTLLYIDALVEAGKQFEMQIYPDDNHFLRKRANYEHLHRRLLRFLEERL